MSAPQPVFLSYEGDGEFKAVSGHWARICDKQYVVGERYTMEVREERSMGRHRSYFAQVNEAWENLPEGMVAQPGFQSPEHFRKRALIGAGYCDSSTYACGSHREALRMAAYLQPIDEFSLVEVHGTTVTRSVARSQSVHAMGKDRFNESVDAVLDWIAQRIGVERAQLEKAQAA